MAVTIASIYQSLDKYEKDNYYLKESPLQLIGHGWQQLGISSMDSATYKALAQGKDPMTGELLVRGGMEGKHRQGYDITFSPDKSLSVAMAADPAMKEKLLEAHNKAVADTLRYLENNLAQARTREDIYRTSNILAMRIDHTVNRNTDVQFHTHVVLFNMTYNPETSRWQALHSDAFKSNILEKIYENQLAYYLRENGFGVEWKSSANGKASYAAIQGVPEVAIDATSTRAKDIEGRLQELQEKYPGADPGKLKEMAVYETRPDKISVTQEQIQARFEEQLKSVGLTKEDILRGIELAAMRESQRARMSAEDVISKALQVLEDQRGVFSGQDLLSTALAVSRGDVSLEQIQRTIADRENIISMHDAYRFQADGLRRTYVDTVYTTTSNMAVEKGIFEKVERGMNSVSALCSKDTLSKLIHDYEQSNNIRFTESQKNAINHVLTQQDRYLVIQGYAGTGKTASFKAISHLAERAGYKVFGLSETNTAVRELRSAGVDATTVTKFLHTQSLQDRIDSKTIVILDEASFTGNKHLNDIMKLVEDRGARLVMAGDKDQLPAIGAGLPFKDIQEKYPHLVCEMKDIIRQKDENLRQAVESLIERQLDKALSKLEVHVFTEDYIKKAAELYTRSDGYNRAIFTTFDNKTREQLNLEIRAKLQEQGLVGKEDKLFTAYTGKNLVGEKALDINSYQVGDRLLVQRPGAGVRVGAELDVVNIDRQNGIVTAVNQKTGKFYDFNIRTHGDHFNVFSRETIKLSVGDKVIFTANNKKLGIANSDVAYVKAFNTDGTVTFQKANTRETVTINLRDFAYLSYGYASTTYKAQGKTAQNAMYFVSKHANFQDAYVAISRAREGVKVIATSNEFVESLKKEILKETVARVEKTTGKDFTDTCKSISAEISKPISGFPQKAEMTEMPQKQSGISTGISTEISRTISEFPQKTEMTEMAKQKRTEITETAQQKQQSTLVALQKLKEAFSQKEHDRLPPKGVELYLWKNAPLDNKISKEGLSAVYRQKVPTLSFLGERQEFKKTERVIAGSEKGKLSKSFYSYNKLTNRLKGTTVTVSPDKKTISVTNWQVRTKNWLGLDPQKLEKSETTTIKVDRLKTALENLKSLVKDKGIARQIEKAEKHLEKLANTAELKHYEKLQSQIQKIRQEVIHKLAIEASRQGNPRTLAEIRSALSHALDKSPTVTSATKSQSQEIGKSQTAAMSR